MSNLHDVIYTTPMPAFMDGETFDSYLRRVWREGILVGVGWGLAQVAPMAPVIAIPEKVSGPESVTVEGDPTSPIEPDPPVDLQTELDIVKDETFYNADVGHIGHQETDEEADGV